MIYVATLYLFLVLFIIILFYMILLYSDYNTSIMYITNTPAGKLLSKTGEAILVDSADDLKFTPNISFRKKKIYGKLKLVMSTSGATPVDISLGIKDYGSTANEVVGEETTFTLHNKETYGKVIAYISFSTSELGKDDNAHDLRVFSSKTIPADVHIHDSIIYYY